MSIILTLGMHRAGTGMISQALRLLGVHTGTELDEHHEDEDFKALNISVLSQAGGSWHRPPNQENIKKQDWSIICIRKLIEAKCKKSELWGWKDPRMCLLIKPLYWQILKKYDVKIIVAQRHVAHIIASLQKRERKHVNPIYCTNWKALVELYVQSIHGFLRLFPDVPVHYVDYERYTQPDRRARLALINELCSFLEIVPGSKNVTKACDIIRHRK